MSSRTVVDLTQGDYMPGNPEHHVHGKPQEKKARRHAKSPERKITEKTIRVDITLRMMLLKPLVDEYNLLTQADEALEGI